MITPLLGIASSFPLFIALRTIQGIAAATFAPAALSMYPAENRVTAIGFVSTGFLLAGIAGQVLSDIVSQNFSWPFVFYFLGGIYLLSVGLLGGSIQKGGTQHLLVRAAGIVGMLLSPFAGSLVVRFGIMNVLKAGLLLVVLGLGILGISSALPILVLTSVLFVAGISITVPVLISLIGTLAGQFRGAPSRSRGT
ncbi:hypothetical protein BP422_21495 [Brevibacillus formosus]|uniref:Major facilitator superfamily (MFS) profile domain-containing protein n=1 Tax=Brevibacillus formosus TaxID=54913 RepID=A0A220MMC7_9BACL|nr:hypothetical protein BP422_21495 [Brevibacillus formosus]